MTDALPPRVDFNVKAFERLLEQKGLCFTWEKATICFCSREDGTSDPNCTACFGNGYLYFDPRDITVVVTTLKDTKAFGDLGEHGFWILGKVSITSPAKHNLSFKDRLTAKNSQITYSQLLFIGSKERLRYKALEVIFLASEATVFELGVDFIIVDGAIQFLPSKEPPPGTAVTIRYIANPSYIILEAIHEIRDTTLVPSTFTRMPRNHIAELDYLHEVLS